MHDTTHLPSPRTIITANGTSVCNTVGRVTIHVNANESITLTNVFLITDFHANLISVSRLTTAGAEVVFERDRALIIVNREIANIVPRINNVYLLSSQYIQ